MRRKMRRQSDAAAACNDITTMHMDEIELENINPVELTTDLQLTNINCTKKGEKSISIVVPLTHSAVENSGAVNSYYSL